MVSPIKWILKLLTDNLKQPRSMMVRVHSRISNDPLWPIVRTMAQLKLSKTEVSANIFIHNLFPEVDINKITRLLQKIRSNTSLYHHLIHKEKQEYGRPKGTVISGTTFNEGEILYVIIRLLRPAYVVETGVAAGISSTFILQGLNENVKGELYSIDLPIVRLGENGLKYWWPRKLGPGWMIPDFLRER